MTLDICIDITVNGNKTSTYIDTYYIDFAVYRFFSPDRKCVREFDPTSSYPNDNLVAD